MAQKPENSEPSENLARPLNEVLPGRSFLDVEDIEMETRKLNEIMQLLKLPESLSKKDRDARITRALDLYESLAPTDGLEAMLATQMVGTHHAALECLRLAAIPEQTLEARDMNLKHAEKLMSLYTKQAAALAKNQGKGQQKVTVEHVHVAPGGQAIVGNVETGASKRPVDPDPATIEQRDEIPIDIGTSRPKTRLRRASGD